MADDVRRAARILSALHGSKGGIEDRKSKIEISPFGYIFVLGTLGNALEVITATESYVSGLEK